MSFLMAIRRCCAGLMLVLLWLAASQVATLAQAPKPVAAAGPNRPSPTGYRRLAPGVEITIPANLQEAETYSRHDFVEILAGVPNLNWTPKLSPNSETLKQMSTGTTFRRQIWCLELTFKPARMLWVDVPQPDGKMQRKLVWYLLYHVRNPGGQLKPEREANGTYTVKKVDEPVHFRPHFVLESTEYSKAYLDRLIPVAVEAIRRKEDPNRKLLNSVEMAARPIPVSSAPAEGGVWGVATWENVDPRVDFFSIYVQGLSNAYRWADAIDAERLQSGDPPAKGRRFAHKTLVLNFWRPGDEFAEDQRIIHYGMPDKVDHQWVYR